ncbi:MAG: hypothetical protein JW940_19340 [Polyangiaceae bacterium]|nr:hypothetical protein [Polyangiaceae bacterium]
MIARPFSPIGAVAVLSAACSARDVPLFYVAPESTGSQETGGDTTASGGSHQGTGGTPTEASGGSSVAGMPSGPQGGTTGIGGRAEAAGQGSGGAAVACATDAECASGWFCHKPDCAAALGQCEPREVFCDARPNPVCGCDGTTYWNECIWRQVGTGSFLDGECGASARACNSRTDCGSTVAACARLYFQYPTCPALNGWTELPPGLCWVTPARCDPGATTDRWIFCPPPGTTLPPPSQRICMDTCTALNYWFPVFLARPGDGCP